MLESTQHDTGAWQRDWSTKPQLKARENDDVHMTGHILEAQLYLPVELRISSASASSGLHFLARAFLNLDDQIVFSNYCPYSHAGRVLLASVSQGLV